MTRAVLAAFLLAFAALAFGQASEVAKADPQVERRLKLLADELRCLVCQNQTIADSHAPLAIDLRNQIREQIALGKSDGQIRDYMVGRYGDFVLYRPPFKATTALLWLAPVLLLAGGAFAFWQVVRRRKAGAAAEPADAAERERIARLLDGEPR